MGLPLDQLSPFLRTLKCPEVDLDNDADVERLIGDIHGVSRKPALGPAPRYVKAVPQGLGAWSASAIAVAEHLVRTSEFGIEMDPQLNVAAIVEATGLPEEDVRLGLLDLNEAGLVGTAGALVDEYYFFWPKAGLFVEFDRHILELDSRADAVAVATWAVNAKVDGVDMSDLERAFPDWAPRRMNSALNYLDRANLVHPLKGLDSRPWPMVCFNLTDRTRRFVRENT